MTTIELNKTFIIENCDTKKFITYRKKEYSGYKIIEGLIGKKGYIHLYINYNEFEIKPTKIPSGYKKHEFINEEYCGNKKRITNTELNKMKNVIGKGYKHYFIHDNWDIPYVVYIKGKEVQVYKRNPEYKFISVGIENIKSYTEFVFKKTNVENIFIPKPISEDQKTYENYKGNTILIHLEKGKKNKYLCIQGIITEFELDDEILAYYSPIIGSDVPEPIAYGIKNIYFMYYHLYSNKEKFEKKFIDNNLEVNKIKETNKELMSEYLYEIIKDKTLLKNFKHKIIFDSIRS